MYSCYIYTVTSKVKVNCPLASSPDSSLRLIMHMYHTYRIPQACFTDSLRLGKCLSMWASNQLPSFCKAFQWYTCAKTNICTLYLYLWVSLLCLRGLHIPVCMYIDPLYFCHQFYINLSEGHYLWGQYFNLALWFWDVHILFCPCKVLRLSSHHQSPITTTTLSNQETRLRRTSPIVECQHTIYTTLCRMMLLLNQGTRLRRTSSIMMCHRIIYTTLWRIMLLRWGKMSDWSSLYFNGWLYISTCRGMQHVTIGDFMFQRRYVCSFIGIREPLSCYGIKQFLY